MRARRVGAFTFIALLLLLGQRPAFAQTKVDEGHPLTLEMNADSGEVKYVEDDADIPARSVYIELEEIEKASFYDIQVRPFVQKWATPYQFQSQDEQIRLRLTPGHYAIRARSSGENNVHGSWGVWKDFWVNFKAPEQVIPEDKALIVPISNKDEKITFEWPKINLANYYHFILKDKDGKVLRQAVTKNTWFATEVSTNHAYQWTIMPMTSKADLQAKNVEYIWHSFNVASANENMHTVTFGLEPKQLAERYEFEFVKVMAKNKPSEPSFLESPTPDFKARLPAGRYEARVRSINNDGSKSDWSSPYEFFVEIPPPTLSSPQQNEVVESTDDTNSKVRLKWTSIPEAGNFRVKVYKSDGELVVNKTTAERELEIEVPHEETYHWSVKAFNTGQADREPAALEKVSEGNLPKQTFSIDHYTKLDLSTSEEPSQLYGWTRYLTSNMDFQASNYDSGTKIRQSLFGGFGELGVGYWNRKTNGGMLGTFTWAGFNVKNKDYFYQQGSVLYGRRYILENGHRLRVWGGVGYKQTPEVRYSDDDGTISVSRMSTYGPEARASYMFDFNERWGGHIFTTGYYGLITGSTPNGAKGKSSMSYSLGLLGTYKYTDNIKGMFGYTYQADSASYASTDRFGNDNQIQIQGHYLSLTLQFGLEKPER